MSEPKIKDDSDAPTSEELQQAVRLADPFGGDLQDFSKNMENRQVNHQAFLDFVDQHLKEGVDFGKIHMPPKRDDCRKGKNCTNEYHFTKPSLFKPGAEKILGWLGAIPVWPNLAAYEELALNGDPIQTIVLRCEAILQDGSCAGFGFGGRSVSYLDNGVYKDLNRDMKMAKKSALVDCALTTGRLSEHFTQDVEDMTPETLAAKGQERPGKKYAKGEQRWLDLKPDDLAPSGKHKDTKVRDLPAMYLKSLGEKNPNFRKFCEQELDRRIKGDSATQRPDGWKVPELKIMVANMTPSTITALLHDRYGKDKPAAVTKSQQEDLLAFLQAESAARAIYIKDTDRAKSIMQARFGNQAEYRKLEANQMEELGAVLGKIMTIETARAQIPDKFDALVDDWENATGEKLETASAKQHQQLIDSLRSNGFDG